MRKSDTNHQLTGSLLIICAAVLWGTSGTVQTLAPEGATPPVLGAIRIMVSGLVLSTTALIRGEFSTWRFFIRPVFLLTGLFQALYQVTYFTAISFTGVAVGTMVAIGSCPVFTGLLGVIFDREKLSARWMAASSLAVSGLVLLMLGTQTSLQVDSRGILLALTAGFSYSAFTLIVRRMIRSRGSDGIIGISFLTGSIYLIPVLIYYPSAWIFSSVSGVLIMLYLGFISTAFAYMLYGRGLRHVRISAVGTLTLGEPLTAALLGIFFVGEQLTLLSGLGMGCIFLSQIVLVLQGRTRPRSIAQRQNHEST